MSAKPSDNPVQNTAARQPLAPVALSDAIAVGRQPDAAELALLVRAGFRALINNRPDGEANAPLTSAEYAALAATLGLAYVHIPVEGRNPLDKDTRAFAAALDQLPKPIYACCQSGGRSTALWAMASVTADTSDVLIATAAQAGFDVSGLKAKMDMRRELLADED